MFPVLSLSNKHGKIVETIIVSVNTVCFVIGGEKVFAIEVRAVKRFCSVCMTIFRISLVKCMAR